MTGNAPLHKILTALVATVWLVNGLFCKVLHLVPRHQIIAGRILGAENAGTLTITIGLAEMAMVLWFVSGIRPRLCAWVQIILVGAMNGLEFFLVPDLLLFGKMNAVLAAVFMAIVFYRDALRHENSRPTLI